jgi:glutamate synthase domain-containing protein 2/rubredoxin
MTGWKCNLCSHIYDEAKESIKWEDLPEDWVCPICGSPKSSFTIIKEEIQTFQIAIESKDIAFEKYECGLCSFVYDGTAEAIHWNDLSQDWTCPVCGSVKTSFVSLGRDSLKEIQISKKADIADDYLGEWQRASDDFESNMTDIHKISTTGKPISEPMRTQVPTFSWDDILFKGAQIFRLPLNKSRPVQTRTIIGPAAAVPLVMESPIFVTHMSYGALSKEAKLALAKGSAQIKTAMSSGEGGILPESLAASYKYIFEYVPNKYSVTDENLQQIDAIEIKFGQSAKPGMGGHLPAHKVTREIAQIRGLREGKDITSPSCFPDIRNKDDLKVTIEQLRKKSGGKPIGIKLAAGHLEEDIKIAVYAGVDFITIDGRAGGTGSAPKVVKNSASVPTIFALARTKKILRELKADHISLIITGGFRVSSDFAKALAMGADAVALGTSLMMALGCQQYRICDTGKCPVGIATQDPALRARFDVEQSAARVSNYFKVCTEEIKDFARMSGNDNVHSLSEDDICTTNSEISNHTNIQHV